VEDKEGVVRVEIPRHLLFHPNVMLHQQTGPGRSLTQNMLNRIHLVDPAFFERQAERAASSRGDASSPLELDPFLIVAFVMLIEERQKGSASFWFPYIDLLPNEDAMELSIWWNESTLSLIHGTNLFEGTRQIQALLHRVYQLVSTQWSFEGISERDIMWAYSIFASRSFAVYCPSPSRNESNSSNIVDTHAMNRNVSDRSENPNSSVDSHVEPALIPLADIFNHSPTSCVRYINDRTRNSFALEIDLESTASSGVNAVEIFNNYGPKSNEGLLLSYGFCLPHNPNNTYWVQIGISEADPDHDKKISLVKESGLWWRHHLSLADPLPDPLLQTIRISLLSDSDFALIHDSSLPDRLPISIANEHMSHERLYTLLSARLLRIAGSSLENLADIDSAATTRVRFALQYRIEQKTILSAALSAVRTHHKAWARELVSNIIPSALSASLSSDYKVPHCEMLTVEEILCDTSSSLATPLSAFVAEMAIPDISDEFVFIMKLLVSLPSAPQGLLALSLQQWVSSDWQSACIPPTIPESERCFLQGTQLMDVIVSAHQRIHELHSLIAQFNNRHDLRLDTSIEQVACLWLFIQRNTLFVGGDLLLVTPKLLGSRENLPYHPAGRWLYERYSDSGIQVTPVCEPWACWDRDGANLEQLVSVFGIEASEIPSASTDHVSCQLPSVATVQISFTLSDDDDAAEQKLHILESCDLPLQFSLLAGKRNNEMLMAARVLLLSSEVADELSSKVDDGGRAHICTPLSESHEETVAETLKQILLSQLEILETNLSQAEEASFPKRRKDLISGYLSLHVNIINWHLSQLKVAQ
jgi:hypothetical protein